MNLYDNRLSIVMLLFLCMHQSLSATSVSSEKIRYTTCCGALKQIGNRCNRCLEKQSPHEKPLPEAGSLMQAATAVQQQRASTCSRCGWIEVDRVDKRIRTGLLSAEMIMLIQSTL